METKKQKAKRICLIVLVVVFALLFYFKPLILTDVYVKPYNVGEKIKGDLVFKARDYCVIWSVTSNGTEKVVIYGEYVIIKEGAK